MTLNNFERLRETTAKETRERLLENIGDWRVNYAKLLGIADAVMGVREGQRAGNIILARKLCSYYMRRKGYTYQAIANIVGVKKHETAIHHYKTCVYFLEAGDWDYTAAHKQAEKMGIAV